MLSYPDCWSGFTAVPENLIPVFFSLRNCDKRSHSISEGTTMCISPPCYRVLVVLVMTQRGDHISAPVKIISTSGDSFQRSQRGGTDPSEGTLGSRGRGDEWSIPTDIRRSIIRKVNDELRCFAAHTWDTVFGSFELTP